MLRSQEVKHVECGLPVEKQEKTTSTLDEYGLIEKVKYCKTSHHL